MLVGNGGLIKTKMDTVFLSLITKLNERTMFLGLYLMGNGPTKTFNSITLVITELVFVQTTCTKELK